MPPDGWTDPVRARACIRAAPHRADRVLQARAHGSSEFARHSASLARARSCIPPSRDSPAPPSCSRSRRNPSRRPGTPPAPDGTRAPRHTPTRQSRARFQSLACASTPALHRNARSLGPYLPTHSWPERRIVVRPLPSTYSMTTDSTPIFTRRYWPAMMSPSCARIVLRQSLNAASLIPPFSSSNPMYFNGMGGGGGGGGGPLSTGAVGRRLDRLHRRRRRWRRLHIKPERVPIA